MTTNTVNTAILTPQERVAYYQTHLHPFLADNNEKLKQHMQFLKETTTSNKAAAGVCGVMCVGIGTFGGSVVGAEVGGLIGRLIDEEDGEGSGKMIGSVIGAVTGFVGGLWFFKKVSEKDPVFNKWRNDKQTQAINNNTSILYSADPLLKQFVCQITQNVVVAPAWTPTGYLVEHEMIMRMNRDPDGKIECPFTRKKFMPIEVKRDAERALVVNKKILVLIQQDIEAAKENPSQVLLLRKLEATTKEIVEVCYQNCVLEIEALRIGDTITAEECQRRRDSFFKVFGGNSRAELDWSLDWKEILDNRWKKNNPSCKMY